MLGVWVGQADDGMTRDTRTIVWGVIGCIVRPVYAAKVIRRKRYLDRLLVSDPEAWLREVVQRKF